MNIPDARQKIALKDDEDLALFIQELRYEAIWGRGIEDMDAYLLAVADEELARRNKERSEG